MPETFALVAGVRAAYVLGADGELETLGFVEAKKRLDKGPPPMVCHTPQTAARLGMASFAALDLLELFAFVRPAWFALPTPQGLAEVLGLALPTSHEDEAVTLVASARALLGQLQADAALVGKPAIAAAIAMQKGGWPWAEAVLAALGHDTTATKPRGGFRIWGRLGEWEERPAPPKAGDQPVSPTEARARLDALLAGGLNEKRPEQQGYCAGVSTAFDPATDEHAPVFVLAEAGTGVGKTLGYIAPASVWAEKNDGTVWISTYTRNLQRQLDAEMNRLYPDAEEKRKRVVVRKGRENYFCILNFEEALGRLHANPQSATALGLVARWAEASQDGDMVGGDFPAWLEGLLGRGLTTDLTDTRGECLYSACAHYRKCFIEHSQRRAKHARLVIANHALVMIQAAIGAAGGAFGDAALPTRYVFDEGHHLFAAADSAFSARLSGYECSDLRRWLLGAEQGGRSRSRGIKTRLEDWLADDEKLSEQVDAVRRAAHALPAPGWRGRLESGASQGSANGPTEAFLALVRQQVYARDKDAGQGYSLECTLSPPAEGLVEAAAELDRALLELEKPVVALGRALAAKLDDEASELDSNQRARLEGFGGSLQRRALLPVKAWRAMLDTVLDEGANQVANVAETDVGVPVFVDWLNVERSNGRDMDVAFSRHWVDPTRPLAATLANTAEGVLVTSATLRDETDWDVAAARTGAAHMPSNPVLVNQPSPFDYAAATRIFVVTDVNKNDAAQVASAYRELFLAAGGGALGLFTAINRLKRIYEIIAPELDQAGLKLLAQHIDPLDVGTLIDIFRSEEHTCLLGTDAVRDGIDVPGNALRLIVFDRVPWPRPDIVTRARRAAFGGRAFDDMQIRFKLKQAYGRLIRRASDRGVFVMLDSALPSRLHTAFPKGVEVVRLGLKDAISQTSDFLSEHKDD